MKITVERLQSGTKATISAIFIDGKFQSFGLEDPFRTKKIAGQTRIPAGIYRVTVRKVGGTHTRYKKRFDFHEGMLWVRDVPNFEYILIHVGNTPEDTDGCLLVGKVAESGDTKSISKSVLAYKSFYKRTISAAKRGNLFIEYIDRDRG